MITLVYKYIRTNKKINALKYKCLYQKPIDDLLRSC